jgi:hypothetical protein
VGLSTIAAAAAKSPLPTIKLMGNDMLQKVGKDRFVQHDIKFEIQLSIQLFLFFI